jgi:phage terminase large subunit-like protein
MVAKKNLFNQSEFLLELSDRLKEVSRAPNIGKYKPHEKQHKFHSSKQRKKLYIGGNRSGKTTGGVTEAIWRATCTHPYRPDLNALGPTRGRVIAVDFPNGVEKIIFPQYKQWVKPSMLRGGSWETAYDKFLRTLHFVNGSTIEFMSYDQDLVKFAGTSRHWIHFDEEPPHPIYVENLARLIDTDGDFWITMTPVEGITWVYDELYEKKIDKQDDPDVDVLIIEINSLENPYLSGGAIESFLDGVDEDEVTARIGGRFVQVGGRVYKNFDPTVGGLHVLTDPIDDPKEYFRNWLWICSLDHGLNNPTAVLWIAIDQNGFGVVFDEHYAKEWTIDMHAKEIQKRVREHGRAPDLFVADPSIGARNGVTGTSIQQEYIKHGIVWTLGNNDVKAGIVRVKKYWRPIEYVGLRKHPLFVRDDDPAFNTFPRLRISPKCSNLIWELKRYRWKTYANKKLAYENNAYDEPHKKDDHAADSLRYALMTQPDLFAESEAERNASLKGRVDDAMAEFSNLSDSMVTIIDPFSRNLNDPHDRIGAGWSEGNSTPSSDGTGWQFDEHLGMDY